MVHWMTCKSSSYQFNNFVVATGRSVVFPNGYGQGYVFVIWAIPPLKQDTKSHLPKWCVTSASNFWRYNILDQGVVHHKKLNPVLKHFLLFPRCALLWHQIKSCQSWKYYHTEGRHPSSCSFSIWPGCLLYSSNYTSGSLSPESPMGYEFTPLLIFRSGSIWHSLEFTGSANSCAGASCLDIILYIRCDGSSRWRQ